MKDTVLDAETVGGFFGALTAIILPAIENLETFAQLAGSFLGLALLVLSIRHKILQIRSEKRKLKDDGDN